MKMIVKIKKYFKKHPYILPISIIVLLLSGLLVVIFFPQISQYITYDGDIDDDSTTINDPWSFLISDTYIWEEIYGEYEEIIYIHADGSNETGGRNWEEAYTDLPSAIARAQGTPYWTTLLLVGRGTWDVSNPVTQLIDRNIILIGAHRDSTKFVNYHPTASSVFTLNRDFQGFRFSVMLGDTVDGIIIEDDLGSTEKARVRLDNIRIHTNLTTIGNPGGLETGDTVSGGYFHNMLFSGRSHGPNTIAINVSSSRYNVFDNIIIDNFNTGILIEGNSSDANVFQDVTIGNATIGIDIDAGNDQDFHHIEFRDVTTQVDDEVGDHTWNEIEVGIWDATIWPNNLIGVAVNADGVADTYGVETLIHDCIACDEPFYVLAILFEPNAGEKFGIRLSNDFGATYFFETIIEAKFANQVDRYVFSISRIFNAHSRIWCSVKSESGGNQILIWVEIIII